MSVTADINQPSSILCRKSVSHPGTQRARGSVFPMVSHVVASIPLLARRWATVASSRRLALVVWGKSFAPATSTSPVMLPSKCFRRPAGPDSDIDLFSATLGQLALWMRPLSAKAADPIPPSRLRPADMSQSDILGNAPQDAVPMPMPASRFVYWRRSERWRSSGR